MQDTSPPILSAWSGLAAPLCCLANKSQARRCSESLQSALEANLNGPGSMIYQTVWKTHVTPLGRQIYRLRASARRTSDSEPSSVPSGWPTPRARGDAGGNRWETNDIRNLEDQIRYNLSGWPTPNTPSGGRSTSIEKMDITGRTTDGRKHTASLEHAVKFAGWATPVGQQANGTPEEFLERKRKSMANGSQSMGVCLSDLNMQVQACAGWPKDGPDHGNPMPIGSVSAGVKNVTTVTNQGASAGRLPDPRMGGNGMPTKGGWNTPRATDGSNGGPNQAGGALTPDAALSGWPTPTTRDYKGATENTLTRADGRKRHDILDHAALISHWPVPDQAARITADGTMLTGCSAGMESGGQLNPAFSGWLMGFPEAWCHAAISCQLPTRLRKAPKRPVA